MTFPLARWVQDSADWPNHTQVQAMTPQHRARLAADFARCAEQADQWADGLEQRIAAIPTAISRRQAKAHRDQATAWAIVAEGHRTRAKWHRLVIDRLTQEGSPT